MLRLDEANKAVTDTREKIDQQNQQLSVYEAEMKLLRQRGDNCDCQRQKYKSQIDMLQDAVNRARVVSNVIALLLSHFVKARFTNGRALFDTSFLCNFLLFCNALLLVSPQNITL